MSPEEIQEVIDRATVAFHQIKKDYDCDDAEAARILKDALDFNEQFQGARS